ncbi:uncharacterized protein LOC114828271 [Galendromus occidentalis]|uniref:Uncharacterized protein LOC114828271 n=1 Tax=Galendromus occidentalis TaxID=34638 RepID=A0AAJ7SGC2_9ACAR|nr:uncharacterized protein LOC114828271 [Galendromus occidentalis]
MPKVSASKRSKLGSYEEQFGAEVLSTDGSVLLCKVCEKEMNAENKLLVTQHLNGINNESLMENRKQSGSTTLQQLTTLVAATGKNSQFSTDLFEALVSSGIPLWKLENEKFKSFLRTYTKQQITSSVTWRTGYLKSLYEGKLAHIKEYVGEKRVWISIDESTDAVGRFVAHTIVGTLEASESKSFPPNAKNLEKTNSSTIVQAFLNSWTLLWPDGIKHERVLLFLSDGAAYMKKAGSALQVIFPKMVHATCAAHAVHQLAEEIRTIFPDVDKLVSNGKKIFLRSAARVSIFREIAPGVPLPPQPVLTRWGTWLNAAVYYADHFDFRRFCTLWTSVTLRASERLLNW